MSTEVKGAAQAVLCFYFSAASLVQHFTRASAHQTIEVCVGRESIGNWNESPAAADQAATGGDIGDVAELRVRDVQQLRQFLPVSGGLIEQDQELAVCQHQPRRIGAEQLINVLC